MVEKKPVGQKGPRRKERKEDSKKGRKVPTRKTVCRERRPERYRERERERKRCASLMKEKRLIFTCGLQRTTR